LDDMRGRADTEVAATLQSADEQLKRDGEAMATELRAKAEDLSATLAGRILGVDVSTVGR
jgi:F-type H+-transporting ATPase subunit b